MHSLFLEAIKKRIDLERLDDEFDEELLKQMIEDHGLKVYYKGKTLRQVLKAVNVNPNVFLCIVCYSSQEKCLYLGETWYSGGGNIPNKVIHKFDGNSLQEVDEEPSWLVAEIKSGKLKNIGWMFDDIPNTGNIINGETWSGQSIEDQLDYWVNQKYIPRKI